MDAPSRLIPKHSDIRLDDRTPVSSAASSASGAAVSMFRNANNARINNSSLRFSITLNNNTNTYNTNSGPTAASSLDLLYKTAAPNAILNAGGRADEVRCHPGTREEVIGLVEKYIAQEHNGPRMLWLSGPAGAGKSAIIQTVAERCEERGVPQANFFFFRADSTRSDASALVATLVHQIVQLYPSVGPVIAATLASNPLIFRTDLQKQFNALIHRAMPTNEESDCPSPLRPLTLLIDGLDECDSETKTAQRQLLQALDTLLIQKGPYFRVVVASRVESQISMAFKQLRSQVDSIFLDDQYSPANDIRLFVTAEFEKIKSTHSLAHKLDHAWPSESDVAGIVSKSSGQFIFAATIIRFIAESPASPVLNLQKVQGVVPPVKNSPFAHLDAVYSYILEQVDDLEAAKAILALQLLDKLSMPMIRDIMYLYQPRYSAAVVDSCISELASIIHERYDDLEFFHASFPDFLLDKSRSRHYHVDLNVFYTAVFPTLWAPDARLDPTDYSIAIECLKHVQQPTHEITIALMAVPLCEIALYPHRLETEKLVENLHRLYDPQSFSNIMRKWTSANPSLAPYFWDFRPQCATFKSNPEVSSIGTQETSRRKHAVNFILSHLPGIGKSGK